MKLSRRSLLSLPWIAACGSRRGSEFVLGVLAARTGARAPWGIDLLRGIELAAARTNNRGGVLGRRVRVAVADDESVDGNATSLANRLIDREGSVVLFGELSSLVGERAATAAARKGIPFIAAANTARDLSRVNDHTFRTALTDAEHAIALARYLREGQQRRKCAVLYRRSSLLHLTIADAFERTFRSTGGELVLRETFGDESDTELVHLAARVRSANADVLFVPALAADAARVALAARNGRVVAQLAGTDGWNAPELRRIGGDAVLGAVFTDAFASNSSRPVVERFVQEFRAANDAQPGTFAALGFDATRWVLQVAARLTVPDARALREALPGTALDDAVAGAFSIDPQRALTRSVQVLRVDREGNALIASARP